jgi:hypothetical protein
MARWVSKVFEMNWVALAIKNNFSFPISLTFRHKRWKQTKKDDEFEGFS